MPQETLGFPVYFGVTGAAVLALGAAIRFRGATSLIAGYDPDRVTDETALARFFGGWTIALGAAHLAVAAAALAVDLPEATWVGYVVAILAWVVAVRRGAQRYEA